jgi:hypothetical protein
LRLGAELLAIACVIVILLSLIGFPLVTSQSGDAGVTRNRNLQPFENEPGNADVTQSRNLQPLESSSGNADVTRSRNLQAPESSSGNADVSRYRNMQSAESSFCDADVIRYRNLQSFELASPPTYDLTVEVKNSTSQPIAGATVAAYNVTSVTNSSGYVEMILPSGKYNVTATHPDYLPTSWIVDLGTDRSITLTLACPFSFLGEIPDSYVIVYPIEGGYNISLLDVSASSSCDVFFNWEHVGTLQNGTAFQNFTYGQLPDLIIEAARKSSLDYPKAWYKYLVPLALTPITGEEGAFLPEPVPYATASIFVIPYPPVKGSPTILGVTLHNPFAELLHISRIDFQVSGLTIGGYFTSVGYLSDIVLEIGQMRSYNITWTPNVSGHHCIKVVLTYSPIVQTAHRNIEIITDVAPGTLTGNQFDLRNRSDRNKTLVIKVDSDCPETWLVSLVINGRFYDNIASNEILNIPNVSPGLIPAELQITYPKGAGSKSHINIEGYIDDTLIGGIQKIVIPTEVTAIDVKNTTFTPERNGFTFKNWGERVEINGWRFENGHCFGMAVLSWNLWHFGIQTPQDDPLFTVSGLVRTIQYSAALSEVLLNQFVKIRARALASDFQRGEYETTETQIGDGNPVVLLLTKRYDIGSGHSVVAYKIEDMGEGIKYVYIYDPNYPGDSTKKIVVRQEGSIVTMQPYEGYDIFGNLTPLDPIDVAANVILLQGFSNYDIHVYDRTGRHTGFNYFLNEKEQNIPNATYTGIGTEPQAAGIFTPYNGLYRLVLVATDSGAYHLTVQTVNLSPTSGWEASEHWFNGTILKGQSLGFAIVSWRDAGGKLRIQTENIHETGVLNIALSKTVVGQGYQVRFRVHLQNYGDFVENLAATAYVNATELEAVPVTLTNRSSEIVTFTWDTTGFAKGNYTIRLYASPVVNEIEAADNNVTGGWVIVAMVGDVSSIVVAVPDGRVDSYDLEAVTSCYGAVSPSPNYNPNYDINDDGKIDAQDLFIIGKNFGQIDP